MDPVTHFLFGGAMGRAGFNRLSGLATATLVLAAEAPDLDILWSFAGPVAGFAHHRGITHTFLGAPFMAALVTGLMGLVHRWMRRRGRNTIVPVRWRVLYLLALLGSLSHLLLDFTNNYGVRPFFPFNPRWYHWDIVFIVEPAILVALALGWIAPWFAGLIGGEIGARRQKLPGRIAASTALIAVAMVWWVRDYNHRKAVTLLNAGTYRDAAPMQVEANPYMLNPFHWLGVVETQDFRLWTWIRTRKWWTHRTMLRPFSSRRRHPQPWRRRGRGWGKPIWIGRHSR